MKKQFFNMDTLKKNTRPHTETDSDGTEGEITSHRPHTSNLAFPRFLVIHSTEDNFKITNLSPFVIEKTLQSIAGVPKSVKKLRTGDLLVEVEKAAHAQNLLNMTSFFSRPCKCVAHRSLNSSRGVIRCPDLAGVSETEIVQGLADQHVTAARRIKIKRSGKEISTNTIILTFCIPILPSVIKIGYLRTKISIYIPNPLQCYNCFKFGHNEKNCKSDENCHKCGQNGFTHNQDNCNRPMSCVNCSEPHSAKSRECKTWKVEKEVLHVKFTQGIGFPEARQIVNAKYKSPTQTSTYASITKSNSNKTTQCIDASTQYDPTHFTNLQQKPKIPAKPTQTTPVQTATAKPSMPTVIQNIPKYSSAQPISKVTTNAKVRGVSQTPKQKIDLKTDGFGKGSNDPIQTHNRFPLELNRLTGEDDDDPPSSPPSSLTQKKEAKITRVPPPESMQH
jgi:hypothetical protein